MQISMTKCKRRLAMLWFFGSGLLFFLLFFQTILGHYGEKANEAWGWLLPTIMPTLSLIVSVFVIDVLGKGVKIKRVNRFIFRLSFSLSAVYLLVVSLTILLEPFTSLSPLELMEQANKLWLGVFQGLVSASIGVFFFKREDG